MCIGIYEWTYEEEWLLRHDSSAALREFSYVTVEKAKARLERTTIADVCKFIRSVQTDEDAFLIIFFDYERIARLRLNVRICPVPLNCCSV